MDDESRTTKEGCIPMLLRDVPLPLHAKIKKLSSARGISMRALLLELARNEYDAALEKGEISEDE